MKEKINSILNTAIKTGMIIFVIGSPFSISLAQIGLVPAILFWIVSLIINQFKNFKPSLIDIPIVIYLLGELITSIFCEYSKSAFAGYQGEWHILMVYLILSIQDKNFYKKLLKILFITSVIVALYGLYQHFTGWDLWRQRALRTQVGHFYGITGGFGLHLTFGGYFMMIALLSLSYFSKFKRNKFLYIMGTFFILLSTIGSYAKSAWIGVIAGLIFIIFTTYHKHPKRIMKYSLILFLFLVLAIFFIKPIKHRIFTQSYSFAHRTAIWNSALQIIKAHPIIGIGNGNFKRYSEKYMKDTRFPVQGHPHNDYINIYLTAGLIGFIGYMLIWFILLKAGIKYITSDKPEKNLMIGLLAGIVSFMVAGLGQNYFTDSENSMLLWLFIAGVNLLIKEERQQLYE